MNDARPVSSYARKPRIGLWVTGAIVLAVLALVVAAGTWQMRADAGMEAKLAEIARSGLPTTAAELEAFYVAPPEDRDTTTLWMQGAAPLSAAAFQQAAKDVPIVGNDAKPPPPGQPWSELQAASDLLKQYQTSLTLFHQAAAQGSAARYPTKFAQGASMLLTHAQDLRGAARLLELEAVVRAHQGDVAGVVQSIETGLGTGRSLENEPLPISQLVRMACDGVTRRQFTSLLPHVAFSDQDLQRLQERLSQIEYESGLRRALAGERVLGQIEIQNLGGPAMLLRGGAREIHLDTLERLMTAAQSPWPQALVESQQVEKDLKAEIAASSGLANAKYMLAAPVAGSLEKVFEAAARNRAHNDATIAAIAIERYRRQHGSLPEDLTELAPGFLPYVPMDPFSGRPLNYIVSEEGYAIYNVGVDGVDNNGEGDETGKPDDVLRIKLPKK